ncbi:hypothetical protein IHE45_15G011800 [Dioscorea alata]|uniref:Uncharacterized protein n=1 Tax=Dioscorea alata TaxID=55571 RepID=A0ACB7UJN7_DIOAL|nr:hypothetical protein IHE45_15G011800 [Dioscorea alata]
MDFPSILKPANPDETMSQTSGGGKLLDATETVVIDTVTNIASGDILEPFTGHAKHDVAKFDIKPAGSRCHIAGGGVFKH